MYADDCCIYVSGPNISELIRRANEELITINSWINCNRLTLNSDKTHYLIFHRKKTIPVNIDQLKINSIPITQKSNTNFLGVILDTKLNWKDHISHVQSKVNKQCGILYQVRDALSTKALKTLTSLTAMSCGVQQHKVR